jgi:hypothetical protein
MTSSRTFMTENNSLCSPTNGKKKIVGTVTPRTQFVATNLLSFTLRRNEAYRVDIL